MNGAAEILVIILSVVLAIFLILGITLIILLIRVTRQIKKVTNTAGQTVDAIQTAVKGMTKVTSPMFLAGHLVKQVKKYTQHKK